MPVGDSANQLTGARAELDQVVAQVARLDAERDELLHLLIAAQSNGLGRLGLHWQRFTEEHRWAQLMVSRPSAFLWSVLTLRKPGFLRINPLFDAAWYTERYPDVPRRSRSAWLHYRRHGVPEGRDPNPWFDTRWYLEQNPDVANGRMNPLDHYLLRGWREARDPSARFDGFDYMRHHPECVIAARNPLLHFLRSGERSVVEVPTPPGSPAISADGRRSAAQRTVDFYRRNGAMRTMSRIKDEVRGNGSGNGVTSVTTVALAEQVRAETIQAHIDSPVADAIEGTDAMVLAGWACSPAGIESVSVYLGTRHVGQAVNGQSRPDVAVAFPSIEAAARSGFSLRTPLEDVEAGRETLQVIIRDASGATRVLRQPFQRVAPEAAYHHYYELMLPTPDEIEEYRRWATKHGAPPHIHICVQVEDERERDVRATIRSISTQTYGPWTCSVRVQGSRAAEVWDVIRDEYEPLPLAGRV